MTSKFHVVHILYRLDTGGLENGVVNLINHLDPRIYKHSIITLNGSDDDFAKRIHRNDVEIIDVEKQPGRDWGCYKRIYRALKKLKPDCLHTRNLTSIEYQIVAKLAGVPHRLHGEHGWDETDLGGTNKKNQTIRKIFKPFIQHFIGLSSESIAYLKDKIGVAAKNITHITNGVDISKFKPDPNARRLLPTDFQTNDLIVFGTVGRLARVKNQTLLLQAFIRLCDAYPQQAKQLRLVIVGEGILRPELEQMAEQAGIVEQVWLAGNRADVAALLPALDVFVLPSLAEGISNTILEAMACGVPVIATRVGGNTDLIESQFAQTHLVDCEDPREMVASMAEYVKQPEKIRIHSDAARLHCEQNFSIEAMVGKYHGVYQALRQRG